MYKLEDEVEEDGDMVTILKELRWLHALHKVAKKAINTMKGELVITSMIGGLIRRFHSKICQNQKIKNMIFP